LYREHPRRRRSRDQRVPGISTPAPANPTLTSGLGFAPRLTHPGRIHPSIHTRPPAWNSLLRDHYLGTRVPTYITRLDRPLCDRRSHHAGAAAVDRNATLEPSGRGKPGGREASHLGAGHAVPPQPQPCAWTTKRATDGALANPGEPWRALAMPGSLA
jgi:hypothetical protein